MMQFCVLGSGSGGNATIVRAGETVLLVDAGSQYSYTDESNTKTDFNNPLAELSQCILDSSNGSIINVI